MNKTSMFVKTGRLFLAFATGLLILSACSQNEETPFVDDNDKTPEIMTIVANQGGSLTRMTHEDGDNHGLIVKWTAGDAFRVYGYQAFTTLTISSPYVGNGKTATFTGNSTFSASNLNAFFPDSRAENRWEDCYFNVLGQVQDADNPFTHLADYNYMTAKVDFGQGDVQVTTVDFTHKIAVLKFMVTLPNDVTPKSITLSTQNDAGIAVTQKASDETAVTTAKQLTMVIANAKSNIHTAYMAILPSTLKQQLAVAVTGSDGMVYNYTAEFGGNFSYEAGKVYNATLVYGGTSNNFGKADEFNNDTQAEPWSTDGNAGESETNPYLITNAKQLKQLATNVNAGSSYAGKHFRLTTDIHVTASTWTPIGNYVYNAEKPFSGNFDGGGHTISGSLNAGGGYTRFGLFGYTSGGSVSNLHLAADVIGNNNTSYVGGVIGCAITATSLSYCTISGIIRNSFTSTSIAYTGGLCGDGCINISYCVMNGEVRANVKDSYVGGIVGRLEYANSKGGKISQCTNVGIVENISSPPVVITCTGGICGYHIGSMINGCRNNGAVSAISSSSSANINIGGIAGYTVDNVSKIHTSYNASSSIVGTRINGETSDINTGLLVGRAAGSSVYDCCSSIEVDGLALLGSGSLAKCITSYH